MPLGPGERRYGGDVRDADGRMVVVGGSGQPAAAATFVYLADTVPDTAFPPADEVLREVSVAAGDAAATVTIGGGPPITVPAGQAFTASPNAAGIASVDIAGGGSGLAWYVAWSS